MSEEFKVKIGIIGGTGKFKSTSSLLIYLLFIFTALKKGLNKIEILEDAVEVEVDTIFGKPSDKLVCGKLNNVDCVLLSRHDKNHLTGPTQVNYRANLLALKNVGCNVIVVTTACGSLNENYKPGDLVILDDFIDRTTKRAQTFYDGTQPDFFNKICHIPMYPAFSAELREILIGECEKAGLDFHKTGTMVTIEGPRFSSKAESKMFQQWGAHTINMTTCPEVYLAKELGLPYASIAIVTDYDCWRDGVHHSEHVQVDSVLKMFKSNLSKVTDLILSSVKQIAAQDWQPTLAAHQDLIKSSIL
jgi:5'-methylthioadenosine phosphorylase